uniref:Putative basic tail protein n=1 Tax=Amblyomma cajennense TaxID=34607 RepID=A0A023FRS7_AMBCJ
MVLLLFLSIFLLNEVHGDYDIVRGCPPKDAGGQVVEDCNYYCNHTHEGYYVNGTRCKITHIPGVTVGVCIDLLGMEGCHPPNDTFARRFMKFWVKDTATSTTGTQETKPTTVAPTPTTQSSTTTKSKSTKKPKKTKSPKTKRPKTKTPKKSKKTRPKGPQSLPRRFRGENIGRINCLRSTT